MRKPVKIAVVATLVSLQLMTVSGCGCSHEKVGTPDNEDVVSTSASALETREFTATGDNWKDSNYQKYWYEFEMLNSQQVAEKFPDYVRVKVTDEGLEIFKRKKDPADTTVSFQVVGNDMVQLKEDCVPEYWLDGCKIWYAESEEEKQALENQDYSKGQWVNGIQVSELIREIDNVVFLDLTDICNKAGLIYTKGDQTITIQNHPFPTCDFEPNIEMSTDKVEQVIDPETLNMYYAVYFDSSNMRVYATPEVLKHIVGWDVSVNGDNAVVWVDELYTIKKDDSVLLVASQPEDEPDEEEEQPEQEHTFDESAPQQKEGIKEAVANKIQNKNKYKDQHYDGPLSNTEYDYLTPEEQEVYLQEYMWLWDLSREDAISSLVRSNEVLNRPYTEFHNQGFGGNTGGGGQSSIWA